MNWKEINSCRVCGESLSMKNLFDLGNPYISTFVKEKGENIGRSPLAITECTNPDCGLVQTRHNPPQELLYPEFYWYRSSLNPVIENDLKTIADWGSNLKEESQKNLVWADIGANDGTLLKYVNSRFYKVAIEPANNLIPLIQADKILGDFWEKVRMPFLADIITAIGMFYDSEDPNLFIKNVKNHLAIDGVFIAQMMGLPDMLENNDLGNICHEHLEYYDYKSLRFLFEKNGLEIFRVEKNFINGGSYKIFARHYNVGSIEFAEESKNWEEFGDNLKKTKNKLLSFLEQCKQNGQKCYGLGASTKANTFLQYFELSPDLLPGILEIHPDKIGKYTVGTNIPIIPEKHSDADFLLVFPYAFKDFFIRKHGAFINRGGKFIFCTPKFEIV